VSGTSVVTVLACDLVESTALMARVGDDAADTIRRGVFAHWRAAIERQGGVVVKTIGDAVMAVGGNRDR
jgi:class 3 adenylate cyclase